ncbi:hypothetical protein ACFL6S_04375 [Candidatus Poribacteria bacterium]
MARSNSSGFIATPFHSNYRQVVLLCSLVCILLVSAGCRHGTMNLAWAGPKTYTPPPRETVGILFGINDNVDVLPSGALPITIQKSITNTGTKAIKAGYLIQESVVGWSFVAVAGTAAYVEGDLATRTVFECTQPGPALAPGETKDITFVLGGPGCPPTPSGLTVLPCGMYKETLTLDSAYTVKETDEHDNLAGHFFLVPSDVLKIIINVVRNPDSDSRIVVAGQTVKVVSFAYPYTKVPDTPPIVAHTHNFNISIVPPTAAYTVNGRTPIPGKLCGASGALVPGPMPLTSPAVVDYNVTIPDNTCVGICNSSLGNSLVHEEKLNTKLTAISADGCVIAQKSVLASVIYECDPD